MREIEISLPPDSRLDRIQSGIEKAIVAVGLRISLRATLRKYPGCVHWHVKNGRLAGTLEITLWPEKKRAWFTIQDGRKAEWIETKLKLLQEALQQLAGNAV